MGFKSLIVWTVVCIFAFFAIFLAITGSTEYTESTAKFTLANDSMLFVDAEEASFSGVSQNYFVLRCPGFQAIEPTEEQPPLGWQYKKYFIFHPSSMPTKTWCTVEAGGSIYSAITTQQKGARVIVDRQDESESGLIILTSVIILIIWIVIIILFLPLPEPAEPRHPVKK